MFWKKSSKAASIAASLLPLLALSGCDHQAFVPVKTGSYIRSTKDFGPVIPSAHRLSFCIDGTMIDSALKVSQDNSKYLIEVDANDHVFEQEAYSLEGKSLLVHSAADEDYSPGIPILKAPMYAGDTWNWKGTLGNPSQSIPAEGTVTTSDETLPFRGKSVRAILSKVELTIGEKNPIQRTLRFWITKEHGILKREFGASIRQPQDEPIKEKELGLDNPSPQ